uniref:Putative rna-binding protein 26 n=1 Tax=Culex tarsalis TaxID=7177 RepID=A0A1Q3EZX2_CULTA
MHINNPDALKTWLTEVLEPLCDADPAALARYVLALLKKDKPEKDLRDCMKEQLDVFLGAETEPFLEQLFRSIRSEEYIKVVQAKEAAAAALAAATAAATAQQASPAAAATTTTTSTSTTEQVSSNSTSHNSTSTSSSSNNSKVRIKREFTPPLHESKPSKESLAAGVPSGATVSSSNSSSHETNGSELSSSASSGTISATPSSNQAAAAVSAANNASSKSTPPVKPSSKEDHSKESSRSRGRRISNRSRSRSRSRSFERSRRSRSRDRGLARGSESNREKSNRAYRNKSPAGGGRGGDSFRSGGSSSRYERKNHGSSNSYESRRGGATTGGSGSNRGTIRSQSRSRSPSPVVDRRKMARSESPAVAAAPAIVAAPVLVEHPPAVDGALLGGKRQRCRDFDEKGYCMRGETCPWDHGVDPVVLEDINNPALITIQSAAQLRTGPIHPEYSPDAPELWNRPPNFPPGRPSITQRLGNITGVNVGGGFGPRGGMAGGNFRGVAPGFPPGFPGNPIGATPLQRELISVPVVDANKGGDVSSQQTKRRFEPEDAVAIADGHLKRKLPLNNRLGPRVTGHPAGAGGAVNPQQNCSLELRKIPRGLNAIAHLNNHFSKFGKIVNIQISYDGDPEAAIVTFSTHAEANVAYRSTEAVLNNRFIKVFWHTGGNGGEQPGITPAAKTEHSLRRSYPNQYSINNVTTAANTPTVSVSSVVSKEGVVVTSSGSSGPTVSSSGGENVAPATTAVATGFTNTATKLINTVTTPIVTANQLRMKNAKINRATSELMRKKQELTQTMHKGKYDLMQGYLKELSKLIMMVEKVEATDPMRTKLLAPIKDLESKIAALRAEISSEQTQIAATMLPKRKTKEQHEKDILDAELEIIAAEQRTHRIPGVGGANPQPTAGGPISGTLPGGGKPQLSGPRPARPINRPLGSTSVDRRPTTISITGFAAEDADALLGHFKNFGEITKHQLDKTVPSLLISYSIRQNAEKALARGKAFRDVTLQIGWVATVPPPTTTTPNAAVVVAPVGATDGKDKSSAEAVVEKDAAGKEGADASGKVMAAAIEGAVAGAGTGVDASSAASLDTLTETGSMEEASEVVRMVEEEEEEEEEDRSWRR